MKTAETAKYEDIRGNLISYDIVLFNGKGGVSNAIKWFTRSKWSHIGIVLNDKALDMVLLMESTTLSAIKDVDTGINRRGVMVVPLSERLRMYDGDVCIRPLTIPGMSCIDRSQRLSAFRREFCGRPYEQDKWSLILAQYDGPFGQNIDDLSSLFCSELVAEAYMQIGLLRRTTPASEYTPANFSAGGVVDGLLKEGAFLGEEIYIRR